jgi:hypothetical protein
MVSSPIVSSVDPWEFALWAVAVYLAVASLVRLMTFHRDRLVVRFHAEIQSRRRRQAQSVQQRRRRTTTGRSGGP